MHDVPSVQAQNKGIDQETVIFLFSLQRHPENSSLERENTKCINGQLKVGF